MQNILLVEDAPDFQIMTKSSLASTPFRLSICSTIKEANELMTRIDFQLILLDIGLPDGDGFQFCAKLQGEARFKQIPVIFLTGKDDISDKVTAFSLGAEDYIVKPFHPLDLKVRVEAKLRKLTSQTDVDAGFFKGSLRISTAAQRVYETAPDGASGGERDLQLTPREFKILFYLAKNEGRVLSRDQILSAVWGDSQNVLDRTVDTHIGAIRRKLGPHSNCLESVAGSGYIFVTPVEARNVA